MRRAGCYRFLRAVLEDAFGAKTLETLQRVETPAELEDESSALRRALGWDAVILAREWLDLAAAGEGRYGPVPQEVRTWIVDGVPFAWSFHHLHVVPRPAVFPLSGDDQGLLRRLACRVATAFRSRLVAADFARGVDDRWWFIEAGPGSCAGTAHGAVFKAVARRLLGKAVVVEADEVGGLL